MWVRCYKSGYGSWCGFAVTSWCGFVVTSAGTIVGGVRYKSGYGSVTSPGTIVDVGSLLQMRVR